MRRAMTSPRVVTGGFRLRLARRTRISHSAYGSGSGSGVIFGAFARSGHTDPGFSVRASIAYSFLQRVLDVV
jgi:hypothetical protein